MATLNQIVDEVTSKYGLGSQGGPLVRELLALVTGGQGGIGGFIDRLKGAGLGNLVSSWLGRTDAAPLSVPQVEGALGKGTLDRIAQKLGLSGSVVGPALAYLVPKVIGFLTPDGKIPTGIPSQVSAFLSQPSTPLRAVTAAHRRSASLAVAAAGRCWCSAHSLGGCGAGRQRRW